MRKPNRPAIYGVMAEFDDPATVVAAARRAHEEGYRQMDAYSPYPIHALSEAIGFTKNSLPLIVLIGGIIGMIGGFALQYYVSPGLQFAKLCARHARPLLPRHRIARPEIRPRGDDRLSP
jgi:hypothetical protein